MVNAAHLRLNAGDRSYFAILKKEIHALAESGGLKAKRIAEMDIVVAEIVSNLAKHAKEGEVFVKLVDDKSIPGIEIIALDKGPGINDIKQMMRDGTTTKRSLGQGLGAIKRLSDLFQVYTLKDWGTVLLCRIFNQPPAEPGKKKSHEIHSLVVPKPGETYCGDGFYLKQSRENIKLLLGDGLGHGHEAAVAVNKAIEAFKICPEDSPVENLRFINQAVKKTRGLVATIAIFNTREREWKLCGIGNISTRLHGPASSRHHNPYNGILGLNMPNSMNDQRIPYENGQVLTMCSDGVRSKWDVFKFPGILRHDLSVLNAALFKDFARNTDDMSIASCKIGI